MICMAKPVRDIDFMAFADLTPIVVVSITWADDGQLAVEFASDLAVDVKAAVVRRMCSRNTNEETLRLRAEQALTTNRTYLALPTPTTAQAIAQVAALTRQNVGIIRQMLGELDGTD